MSGGYAAALLEVQLPSGIWCRRINEHVRHACNGAKIGGRWMAFRGKGPEVSTEVLPVESNSIVYSTHRSATTVMSRR
eukprot:815496-Pleurochrysis_carterae.AAC.1